MPSAAVPHLAAAGLLLVATALGAVLDLDGDGLNGARELGARTFPWNGDSDGDTLADGWEARNGLDPRSADPDGDGSDDANEVASRTDPASADSDQDGLADGSEPADDCDGDGFPAGADGDDDADGRLDPLEPAADRCMADVDGDGVLDGFEGAVACVRRTDCDSDGLADALEAPAGLDPLDGDTFDVGLPDSVSWAFAQQGQSPGKDADADGIPDPWEDADGAIVWGDLTPRSGQRDLLIEFLVVSGPDSGRFTLDLTPAYQAVAETFRSQGGIRVTWTETRVSFTTERIPPIVPSVSDPYYASVLARSRHATNPFVTTVVLNPQHDQSEIAHSGIAPIRGMMAAVDYGQYASLRFANEAGSAITLTPLLEELIIDQQNNTLIEAGYDAAGTGPGTRLNIHRADTAGNNGYTLSWVPRWFNSGITVDFDDGRPTTTLTFQSISVDSIDLAHTILHELGHTLGLCHSHDPDCTSLNNLDRRQQALSTMSYDSDDGTLRFLSSEWTTVKDYLTCPPVEPITLLAQDATSEAILDSKYAVTDEDIESRDARACHAYAERPREYEAGQPPAQTYAAPAAFATPSYGAQHALRVGLLALLVVAGAVALDLVLLRRLRPAAP